MRVSIKLFTNRITEKGHPVIVYFKSPNVRKRVVISNFLKNDIWYFDKTDWDFSTEKPIPAAANYELVYPKLINWRKQFNELMLKNETDVNAYLQLLNDRDNDLEILLLEKRLSKLKNENSIGVLEFFNVIINEKIAKGESVEMYNQVKKVVSDFIVDDCSLNDINYEWLQNFILHKKKNGTGSSGIMVYLRTLRALYKEAQRRESLNVKSGNPFLGIIQNFSGPVSVEFNVLDFEKIKNYKPKKFTSKLGAEKMKRAVAIWIFQFAIGGHDFIDVANLKWKFIKNGRIKFKRYKNKSKPQGGILVNNKLFPVALEIIDKYGDKKSDRVFSFIPEPENVSKYKTYRSNFNRSLKTLSEDLELSSIIKSKSTRYIFRSLAGELLVSDLVIMQLQGHKPKGVTFNYQKSLSNSVIDTYHKLIIDKVNID